MDTLFESHRDVTDVAKGLAAHDTVLLIDDNPAATDHVAAIAEASGCDFLNAADESALESILNMRQPTVALVSLHHQRALAGLGILATHSRDVEVVLLGSSDARVLSSARRVAESKGLHVKMATESPGSRVEWERLLASVLVNEIPHSREDLLRAATEHEFVLHYQPRARLVAEKLQISGVEAFVRWNHPSRGLLAPEKFLRSVEREALQMELADYVLTEAVRQCGQWREGGADIDVTVNLSPSEVRDRGFPERLAGLLREHGLPANRVTLDVTESPFDSDWRLLLDVFTQLRLIGVRLAVDHFGVGYSSLTELYRLPYTDVKVDSSLVAEACRDADAAVVVEAIVGLAHTLRLQVCATGVASPEALELVRNLGFDWVQGYAVCRPLDAGATARFLHEKDCRIGAPVRLASARP